MPRVFLSLLFKCFAENTLNIYPQMTSLRRDHIGCKHNLLTKTVVKTVGCWCWLLSCFIVCDTCINCVFPYLQDSINRQTLVFIWLRGFFLCSSSSNSKDYCLLFKISLNRSSDSSICILIVFISTSFIASKIRYIILLLALKTMS